MKIDKLWKKVRDNYFLNDQWLLLESLYVDDGTLTEQNICLSDGKNDCIFCVYIRSFSDIESGWESQPYCKFDAEGDTFIITVPKFKPLSKEDISEAIRFICREEMWYIFNIKIDGERI